MRLFSEERWSGLGQSCAFVVGKSPAISEPAPGKSRAAAAGPVFPVPRRRREYADGLSRASSCARLRIPPAAQKVGAVYQFFGRNYQAKDRSINHLLNHSGQSALAGMPWLSCIWRPRLITTAGAEPCPELLGSPAPGLGRGQQGRARSGSSNEGANDRKNDGNVWIGSIPPR